MTIINLHQHKPQKNPLGNEIASLIYLVKQQSQENRTLFDAQIITALHDLKGRIAKLESRANTNKGT